MDMFREARQIEAYDGLDPYVSAALPPRHWRDRSGSRALSLASDDVPGRGHANARPDIDSQAQSNGAATQPHAAAADRDRGAGDRHPGGYRNGCPNFGADVSANASPGAERAAGYLGHTRHLVCSRTRAAL
jgi:hypothetical protein